MKFCIYCGAKLEDDALFCTSCGQKCFEDVENIPSDIFFADTIPLKDIEIECDERGFIKNGKKCSFRVVIFENKIKKLSKLDFLSAESVGIMILGQPFVCKLYIPIYVMKGYDFIGIKDFWCEKQNEITNGMLNQILTEYLTTWYGIQISLLHPQIKTIYG